jgi:hypothetical protein
MPWVAIVLETFLHCHFLFLWEVSRPIPCSLRVNGLWLKGLRLFWWRMWRSGMRFSLSPKFDFLVFEYIRRRATHMRLSSMFQLIRWCFGPVEPSMFPPIICWVFIICVGGATPERFWHQISCKEKDKIGWKGAPVLITPSKSSKWLKDLRFGTPWEEVIISSR